MNNDTTHYIYRIVCFPTGKCYVGQTNDAITRKSHHFRSLRKNKHGNRYLQRAYNKYGRECFYFEILEDGIHSQHVDEREIYWINALNSNHELYNLAPGGKSGSGKLNGKPITWNGVKYESGIEAAKANGITPSAIRKLASMGYQTLNDRKCGKRICEWNGIKYPSITKAAKAIGVDRETLVKYLAQGFKCDNDAPPPRIKACYWNGVEYPNITAIAKAIGVSKTAIHRYIARGYTCDADVETNKNKPIHNAISCVWNNMQYISIHEAAIANNVSFETMRERLKRGYTCDDDLKSRSKR